MLLKVKEENTQNKLKSDINIVANDYWTTQSTVTFLKCFSQNIFVLHFSIVYKKKSQSDQNLTNMYSPCFLNLINDNMPFRIIKTV